MKMFCFEIKFYHCILTVLLITHVVCMLKNVFEWVIWRACVYFVFKDRENWTSLAIFVGGVYFRCFASLF